MHAIIASDSGTSSEATGSYGSFVILSANSPRAFSLYEDASKLKENNNFSDMNQITRLYFSCALRLASTAILFIY